MSEAATAFSRLTADETLHRQLRGLQVLLQSELLRAGAEWEESLSVLRDMADRRRAFPQPEAALDWYRTHSD